MNAKLALKKRPFLSDVLVELGLITADQAKECLAESQQKKIRIGQLLLSKGYIKEIDLCKALAKQYELEFTDVRTVESSPKALELLSYAVAVQTIMLPLTFEKNLVTIAVADPANVTDLARVEKLVAKPVRFVVAHEPDLKSKIESSYLKHQVYELKNKKAEAASIDAKAGVTSINLVTNNNNDQMGEIENMANKILEKAISDRASDIHIEPQENEVCVRERVDGRLTIGLVLPMRFHAGLVSRFKIMGGLDIAEKRAPQDGRFAQQVAGRKVDFRISTLPTIRGEKVVIRILDKGNMKIGLDNLGMTDTMIGQIRKLLDHPHGLILVCGPTGSGKTTTVYSMLDEIRSPELNILTIEDPVEYNFEIINQVQVNTKAGLTFANILRNFLRQDPDVIMVGEIRDAETAEIAVRAALTGHLVISTIHTNDALSAVTRLTDMGVDPFLISDSLLGVIAQRLVRKLCKSCAKTSEAILDEDPELAKKIIQETGKLFRPSGCPDCHQTGYHGREGIYEVLKLGRDMRVAVNEKAPAETLRKIAANADFKTMTEHGLIKVKKGLTSVEEVLRSTLDLSS